MIFEPAAAILPPVLQGGVGRGFTSLRFVPGRVQDRWEAAAER